MLLDKDILELKGVGKIKAQGLNKLGLYKISDLLTYYPRRYEDQTTLTELAKLKDGMISTVFGKVVDIVESKARKGLTLTKIQILDENVKAELIYFNQPFVKSKFFIGLNIVFRINTFIGSFRWQIYDKSSEIHDIILLIINTILSTCHFFLEFDAIYLN